MALELSIVGAGTAGHDRCVDDVVFCSVKGLCQKVVTAVIKSHKILAEFHIFFCD